MSKVCFFAIDDVLELQELHNIFKNIIAADKSASIFCCAYELNNSGDNITIYSDNIWISTFLSIEELLAFFSKYDKTNNPFRGVVPSDITLLSEEDVTNKIIKYIIYNDGIIRPFQEETFINSNIKSIFWD